MTPSYPKNEAGQWVRPDHDGYRVACCDCGLVHEYRFRVVNGQVELCAFRHERATGQIRRRMRRKFEGVFAQLKGAS